MPDRPEHASLVALVIERFDRTDAKLDHIGGTLAEHSAALKVLDTRIGGVERRVGHVEVQADEAAKAMVVDHTRQTVRHEDERLRVERRSYWVRWGAGTVAAVVVAVLSGLATLYLRGLIR